MNHQLTQSLDGLGRVVHSKDNSAGSTVDTAYDALGRFYTQSNPYYSTSDPTYGRSVHKRSGIEERL